MENKLFLKNDRPVPMPFSSRYLANNLSRPKNYPSKKLSHGLSLIELLVAMVIGLFLIGGITSVMVNGKTQFITEQEMGVLQQNARFVIDEISHDIRMAGYYGCNNADVSVTNSININAASGLPFWFLNSQGLKGFENQTGNLLPLETAFDLTVEFSPLETVLPDTDVVIINRGIPEDGVTITNHAAGAAQPNFTITTATSEFRAGDILAVANARCDQVSIFQMVNASALPTAATPTIQHGSLLGITPNNCANGIRGYTDCSGGTPSTSPAFRPGTQLMRFSSNAYYVGTSPTTGLPTLFRETLVHPGTAATSQVQELISGIDDMQMLYGVDVDTPLGDGIANQYFDANNIPDLDFNGVADWERVVSVNITLILRSTRPVYNANTTVALNFDVDKDGDIDAFDVYNDRFLRQKISATIKIRNRGLGG